MNKKNLAIGFSFFTSIGLLVYWTLVFAGLFTPRVREAQSGGGTHPWIYRLVHGLPFSRSLDSNLRFPSGFFLLKGRELSIPFGIAAGSSLIFLGLYAFLYGFNTGLLFILTVDEIIEIAIKLYCLSVGPFLIVYFWEIRHSFANVASEFGR
jgi:hypothetical protein